VTIASGGDVFGNGKADIALIGPFDELVACLSSGPFRSDRAAVLKTTDPDLGAFVVWDKFKLVDTLKFELRNRGWWTTQAGQKRFFGGALVKYQDRETLDVLESGALDASIRVEDWERAVFVKPTRFLHEEEFRFVICNTRIERNEEGHLISALVIDASERIASAIVDCGTL